MIALEPYTAAATWQVLNDLDDNDRREVFALSSQYKPPFTIWQEWRQASADALLSLVVRAPREGHAPFAVVALRRSAVPDVGYAALLARSHVQFRRPLAALAARIRADLPGFAAASGLSRIEAVSWEQHPTAGRLLTSCGFTPEGMLGDIRRVYAWQAAPHGAAFDTQPLAQQEATHVHPAICS